MAGALLYQAKLGGLGMLEANPSIFGSNIEGWGGGRMTDVWVWRGNIERFSFVFSCYFILLSCILKIEK